MIAIEPGMVWRMSSYSGTDGGCVELVWRKSSYSGGNGGCVELAWRKSSHSGTNGGCVEIGHQLTGIAIRDSKNVTGPTLAFPTSTWRKFLSTVA